MTGDLIERLRGEGLLEAALMAREYVDAVEDLGVTVGTLKSFPVVRDAANLHRDGEITTGKFIEVIMVAIHTGEDPVHQELPSDE